MPTKLENRISRKGAKGAKVRRVKWTTPRTRRRVSQRRHPRMFLSGVQFRIRLDSRL